MVRVYFLELLVLVSSLLVLTRAYDNCQRANHIRCGNICAEKCVCGLGPSVVFTGSNSEGWCCGGRCRVTEETKEGEFKIVFCEGGNYQHLSKPCFNGCNYWPDDPDRGNRSYIACDTVRQCFPEWSVCGDKPFCADISDLDFCTNNNFWKGKSCQFPSQRRCEGPYPGQCIERSKWNDGTRDCIDKSDELEREEYCTPERIQQQKEERDRKEELDRKKEKEEQERKKKKEELDRKKEEERKKEKEKRLNKNKSKRDKRSNKEQKNESESDLKKEPNRIKTHRKKHWTIELEEWVNDWIEWISLSTSALIFKCVDSSASAIVQLIRWIFQKLFNVIESTFVYIGDIIESIEDYLSRTFERIFRPIYITFKGPLENLGWAFRVVTNKILDLLCFSFDVLKTVVIFLFDVIYHLVWLVGYSSSFVVFKLPGELKRGFFTSLELCNLAWSVTWDVVSQATNWTVWLVFFKLPELWEERCWQVIEVSISLLTLLYALMREE